LKEKKYLICAVEQTTKSISLEKFKPQTKKHIALIFGNEVSGVQDDVISQANCCIEIPQFGTKHSLNVSVSIGIVLWSVFSKMKQSE